MKLAYLTLVCALCLASGKPALAQTPAAEGSLGGDRARARQLFEKGGAAFDARRLEEARVALTESFEIHPSYDTAGLLGQTEIELGLYLKAARHLDFCLRHFPTGENLELLEQVKVGLSAVQNQIGTLQIQVNVAGAQVFVDDESVGTTPLQTKVFVQPGKHLVRASSTGKQSAERAVLVGRGAEEVVTLELAAEASEAVAETSPATAKAEPTKPPVSSEASPERNWVPAYVLGGVTVASLVTSLVFRSMASSDEEEVEQLGGEVPPGGCSGASSRECQALADAIDSHDQKASVANVALVVAGVGAAATAGYVTYTLLQPSESQPVKASVGLNGTAGSLFVSGRF